jgi:hypothetical protein
MGSKTIDQTMIKALEQRGFRRCSEWHWRKSLDVSGIDFWPSSGKLRWVGKTWVGGLEAIDKILATGGQRVPSDLREPEPKTINSEDDGVWVTIGADCPWNPTPGIRRVFHFESERAASAARAAGYVGIEDAKQEDDGGDPWLAFEDAAA